MFYESSFERKQPKCKVAAHSIVHVALTQSEVVFVWLYKLFQFVTRVEKSARSECCSKAASQQTVGVRAVNNRQSISACMGWLVETSGQQSHTDDRTLFNRIKSWFTQMKVLHLSGPKLSTLIIWPDWTRFQSSDQGSGTKVAPLLTNVSFSEIPQPHKRPWWSTAVDRPWNTDVSGVNCVLGSGLYLRAHGSAATCQSSAVSWRKGRYKRTGKKRGRAWQIYLQIYIENLSSCAWTHQVFYSSFTVFLFLCFLQSSALPIFLHASNIRCRVGVRVCARACCMGVFDVCASCSSPFKPHHIQFSPVAFHRKLTFPGFVYIRHVY